MRSRDERCILSKEALRERRKSHKISELYMFSFEILCDFLLSLKASLDKIERSSLLRTTRSDIAILKTSLVISHLTRDL